MEDALEPVSAVITASQVASLQKDLETERKRTERLDQLLLTNANLRKKLQDDLHAARQRCDTLSVEVEGMRGTSSVDLAKVSAEAASYKQLYFKSLEEISQLRQHLQEQETLAAQAADERDVLQRRLVFQEEQLNQFSPSRGMANGAASRRPQSLHASPSPRGEASNEQDIVPTTVEIISEIVVDKVERITLSKGGAFGGDTDIQPWLLGPPDEVPSGTDMDQLDEDIVGRRSGSSGGLERLDAQEVQRIVVGLYRRLKASETVLGEVHQSRRALAERNAQLQRDLDHLHRAIGVGKSPYGIRRDSGGVAVSQAMRGKTPLLRPVSAPRRVSPYDASRAVGGPTASRPTSAVPRRPISTNSRYLSPNGGTPPVSAQPSARSFSGQSAVSAARGPAAAAAVGRHPVQHAYQPVHKTVAASTRTTSPLQFQVRQEAAKQQAQLQQLHNNGGRPVSPSFRRTLPAPAGAVLGLGAQKSSLTATDFVAAGLVSGAASFHRATDPPPRLAFARPISVQVTGGLTEEPPVMVRKTQQPK